MPKVKSRTIALDLLKLAINPFEVLGIKRDAEFREIKDKFRKKMIEYSNDYKMRSDACLAYDIMIHIEKKKNSEKKKETDENINYYIEDTEKKNIFRIDMISCQNNQLAGYFYTVLGNLKKLDEEVRKNPKILDEKDPYERNLLYIAARNGHVDVCEYLINKGIELNDVQSTGSTPLHGAAYYCQPKVVRLLLNYGAKTNIRNKDNHLPIQEAGTEEIINLLKESEKDPIVKLFNSLKSQDIAQSLIPISDKLARKITCKLKNLPNKYNLNDVNKKWIPAWHGTNFTCLESIAKTGLKPPGGKLADGEENEVLVHHIKRDKTVRHVKDWATAIFVSPSIFYSADPAYAKEISVNNELYKVLVEVRVKPDSYKEFDSTIIGYEFKSGEPTNVEFRIVPKNEKDVQVVSLTFIKSEFFERAKYFSEGDIFITKNIEN